MPKIIVCGGCNEDKEHYAGGQCSFCYHRDYHQKHRDRILAYHQEWYKKNRSKVLADSRQYREENRDRINAQKLVHYYQNQEQILEYQRQYYQENHERRLTYQYSYYEEHREERLAYIRRYWKDNPKALTANDMRRRARKAGLPTTLTAKQKREKLSIGYCFYCGSAEDLTLDHFVPLAGENNKACGTTLANTVVACERCNKVKHTKMPGEILVQLRLIQ